MLLLASGAERMMYPLDVTARHNRSAYRSREPTQVRLTLGTEVVVSPWGRRTACDQAAPPGRAPWPCFGRPRALWKD